MAYLTHPRIVDRRFGVCMASVAIGMVVLLLGCAVRPTFPVLPADFAGAPRPDGLFAGVEERLVAQRGPQWSGFTLLERNDRALEWRLVLIGAARHSLDLQYYVWFGDTAETLLMLRVIDAADRGVKVRILFDTLGVGPVARQASQVFDRYWNSSWAQRVPAATPRPDDPLSQELRSKAMARVVAQRWPSDIDVRSQHPSALALPSKPGGACRSQSTRNGKASPAPIVPPAFPARTVPRPLPPKPP